MEIKYQYKNFDDQEKNKLSEYFESKMDRLEKLLEATPDENMFLEVKGERFATKSAYNISLTLHIPGNKIMASEDDHTIQEAVDFAMDKIISQVKKFKSKHS